MPSRTGSAWRIWGFWKSQLVELRTGHRTRRVDFRLLAEVLGRCRTRWGCRWKSQNRKNVYLSPYAEELLNSKIIKSFVPELRSRKCFSCFEIPVFYVYVQSLWIFDVRFTHSHIMAMVQNQCYQQKSVEISGEYYFLQWEKQIQTSVLNSRWLCFKTTTKKKKNTKELFFFFTGKKTMNINFFFFSAI